MNEPLPSGVRLTSDGGLAATHPTAAEPAALVAPATADEFNSIIARVIPVACWRVDDIRFEFDSSIVRPDLQHELRHLAVLARQHPPPSKAPMGTGCPLSIFGHADPTGDEDYNKHLSGRRAKAIYALLTRRTELWEQLYAQAYGNDRWGKAALGTMLFAVESREPDANTIGQYERDRGRRTDLYSRYMDKLCGSDLKFERTDFLGGGEDAGGKADYQGCSEFNPVKLFSQEQQRRYAKATDKTERNAENAPNRRVVAMIWRAGSRVTPSRWPCPRAEEGIAACKKRFWSNGDQRRTPGAEARTVDKSRDTFACRFYDRLTIQSPCDGGGTGSAPIILDDPLLGPAKGVLVTLTYEDGAQEQRKADARGIVLAKTGHGAFVDVTYDREGVLGAGRVFLLPPTVDTDPGVWQRLVNLGYAIMSYPPIRPPTTEHLALAVEEFQSEFGIEPNGKLDDQTRKLIAKAHDTDNRAWQDREWHDEVEVPPQPTESKARVS